MKKSQLTARRPYLLRAIYEWLLDNHLTPHLVVNINQPDSIVVPLEYACDGKIILNIAPYAVDNLILGNNEVCFNARFGGVLRQVRAAISTILAIYARENGAGLIFESDPNCEFRENKKFLQSSSEEPIMKKVMTVINGDRSKDTGFGRSHHDDEPSHSRGRPILHVVK